jgi:hypothetical protein
MTASALSINTRLPWYLYATMFQSLETLASCRDMAPTRTNLRHRLDLALSPNNFNYWPVWGIFRTASHVSQYQARENRGYRVEQSSEEEERMMS